MLEAMNRFYAQDDLEKAGDFAQRAAPYMHPRLNSVNVGGIPGSPIEAKDVTMPELARPLAFIFNQAAREEKAGLTGDWG